MKRNTGAVERPSRARAAKQPAEKEAAGGRAEAAALWTAPERRSALAALVEEVRVLRELLLLRELEVPDLR